MEYRTNLQKKKIYYFIQQRSECHHGLHNVSIFVVYNSLARFPVSYTASMGAIWWGTRGTCPLHFFSLGFVFGEVSKNKSDVC